MVNSGDPAAVEDLRRQLEEQNDTINYLQKQLEQAKKGADDGLADWEDSKIMLDTQIAQLQARIKSMDEEMDAKTIEFSN